MNCMNARLQLGSFLLAAAFGLGSCSTEQTVKAKSPETVHIPVIAVQQADIPDLLEAVGNVRAAQTTDLASQTMGNVMEIRVREGDRVQRGQVLALIDETQPRAAVDRAEASNVAARQQLVAASSDLTLAESTLRRYQNLYDRRSLSPQEFDEVKARQEAALARRDMAEAGQVQAEAALKQAITSMSYTRIRAPFDGVVTEKKCDLGTLVTPGTPVFTVEDVHRYRLEVSVNESDLRYVQTGGQVSIAIEALDNAKVKGNIVQIVPAVDPTSRAFIVKIELPADARLRSGLFGRAQFSRGERRMLLIPSSAVVERGQLQGVFVLDENKVASLRFITLGKSFGSEFEVLSGLENGEWIVAKPGELNLDSKRIEGE
jgi:RND family efflux transporter MFP subunit